MQNFQKNLSLENSTFKRDHLLREGGIARPAAGVA